MTTSFDPKTHSYLIDGKKATGVTTVLGVLAKPNLIGWAARMAAEFMEKAITSGEYDLTDKAVLGDLIDEAKNSHTKKKEAAGTHGTDTHALVESYITMCIESNGAQGKPMDVARPEIQKFIDWARENVDHFLFSERRMFNKDMFLAGTADFAYVGKDGKRYMADFKTASGIFGIDFWLQTAAYRMLAEAEGDAPYDACMVVRLGKDGSFEALRVFDYETCKNAFMSCLVIYRAQASLKNIAVK